MMSTLEVLESSNHVPMYCACAACHVTERHGGNVSLLSHKMSADS